MKYWRGFLVAAIVGAFTWALSAFAKSHTLLVDMIWPYVTRTFQTYLADWTSGVAFCIWQVLAIALVALLLLSVLLMIILKWNPLQWLGWVTAVASILFFCHTAVYGLNTHAGSIADDIHLTEAEYTLAELEDAAAYYRDKANALAAQVKRDGKGDVAFDSFAELAAMASEGYAVLVDERSCSVFAGSDAPVKELGWADMYTSMGITGVTFALTGEAAVNPRRFSALYHVPRAGPPGEHRLGAGRQFCGLLRQPLPPGCSVPILCLFYGLPLLLYFPAECGRQRGGRPCERRRKQSAPAGYGHLRQVLPGKPG